MGIGCYQVRPHRGGDHAASHQLKPSMGFGISPVAHGDDTARVDVVIRCRHGGHGIERRTRVRNDDASGVYAVMPLRRGAQEKQSAT